MINNTIKDNADLYKYIFFSNKKKEGTIKYYKLQASIIDKLNEHKYCYCFDEVGTGKTVQGMYAIWDVISNKNISEKSNILVIAPNEQLAVKWKDEIKEFLKLDFMIIHNRDCKYHKEYNDNKWWQVNPRFYENDDNLYITYNSSKYDNLGISKLTNSRDTESEILDTSTWDLIIVDEAHLLFKGFYQALYDQILSKHKTDKLLILTATPIKSSFHTPSMDKNKEHQVAINEQILQAPSMLLNNYKENLSKEIKIENLLKFDVNIPYQRYFKEVVLGSEKAKNRVVKNIEYVVNKYMDAMWDTNEFDYYHDCGNVFLIIEKAIEKRINIDENCKKAYESYNKNEYDAEDIENITKIDSKAGKFIEYIKNKCDLRLVIFCSRLETKDYLEKIVRFLNIKTTILNKEQKVKERYRLVEDFNKTNANKILITTWNIGSVGINIHGADTVMWYETSTDVNCLEQGFGRIDRINLGFENINMIFMKPNNEYNYYDNYRLNSVYNKLFELHLPNIPSKNILFENTFLNKYRVNIEYKCEVYKALYDFSKNIANNQDKKIDYILILNYLKENKIDPTDIIWEIKKDSTIYLDKINQIYRLYEKAKCNLDKFIDVAVKMGLTGETLVDVLGQAIYYYSEGILNIISVKDLLIESKKLHSDIGEKFTKVLDEIDSIDLNVEDSIIDTYYNKLFASAIKKKIKSLQK